MRRVDDWAGRMLRAIDRLTDQPYRLGENDCFRMACAVIEAITGVDRWPEFAGRYSTKRGALALIAAYGGTFDRAFSKFFGCEPLPADRAELGDIVKIVDAAGEAHLGVCLGGYALGTGPDGLVSVPLAACAICWRVG